MNYKTIARFWAAVRWAGSIAGILAIVAVAAMVILSPFTSATKPDAPAPPDNSPPAPTTSAQDAPLIIITPAPVTLTPSTPAPTPEPPEFPPNNERYEGITVTAEERQAIAEIIYWENRNQPDEAIQGAAEVILNRLKDALNGGIWARYEYKTVWDVISDPGQFSTYIKLGEVDPPQKFHELTERAISGESVLPETAVYFNTAPENDNIIAVIDKIYFCGNYKWN